MNTIGLTFFLCFITQNLFAQIPNAGFENWTDGEPDGWWTTNLTGLFSNVSQSGTSHSGSSAAMGEVVQFYTVTMSPTLSVGTGARGFAYDQRPVSITGYYQFYPLGGSGDRFSVDAALYKGGASRISVGIGALAISASSSSYTQFNATFNYLTADIPDTCAIIFTIIGVDTLTKAHVGSYFLLDDLAFSGATNVENQTSALPEMFNLDQNYPNPFNPGTVIPFSLQKGSQVKLRVYNILGKEMATLVNGYRPAGHYVEKFDAAALSSGVYFYRLEAGTLSAMKHMLLIK
jgi:hypothetical protein